MFDGIEEPAVRILFTLSDIDEWSRTTPPQTFGGYVSVIITELHIVKLFKRRMLMSTECCGAPMYSNNVIDQCLRCQKMVELSVNPCILGDVVDETGVVASGMLVLSERAWEELLGRTVGQFVGMQAEALEYLEQRMVFLRLTLGFGWCADVGRLCVWGVKM